MAETVVEALMEMAVTAGYTGETDIDTVVEALDVLGYVMGKGFAGAVKYRGAVASYDELPDDGPVIGDMYNVLAADATHGVNAGDYVAWNGETWDVQGTTLDISPLFDTLTDAQIRELIG